MHYAKGRLRLEDLDKIHDYNEIDLIRVMRDILQKAEKNAEKVVRGNKSAAIELRKAMNDNMNLSAIMRDMVKMRNGAFPVNKALRNVIAREQASIDLENKRTNGLTQEQVEEKIQQARAAEKIRKEEREQKIKERAGPTDSEHKEAQD